MKLQFMEQVLVKTCTFFITILFLPGQGRHHYDYQ